MTDEEKLLWLFEKVHGEMTGACYTEVGFDEEDNPVVIRCMKHSNICWEVTKVDLIFDYLTRHLDGDNNEEDE